MPWKPTNKQEQRFDLVRQMTARQVCVVELCRRFKISRQTAYKWRQRFRVSRLAGLKDRSRRPEQVPGKTTALWLRRLRALRQRRPTWGTRKLRHHLEKRFGRGGLPALATISRWLKRWGLVAGRRRRRLGPIILRPALRAARHCHDVWTVDFKGLYRTADGLRVEPLTVRDLYSRYGLRVALLRRRDLEQTRNQFVQIFRQYGLPRRIRCDNGTPFGAGGPTGLTRLSAWWVKLGIEVEFITPGRPGENGAHEQFHRVYQAEVVRHAQQGVAAQQRRSTQWLWHYNHERPHEALGMKVPAQLFQNNQRRMPSRVGPWTYQAHWEQRWVRGNGEIHWRGTRRYVGEAFVKEYVGLKPIGTGKWNVYFGPLLIGQLHQEEPGSIRMAKYRPRR
jgi:transposase InsO family protein